MEFMNNKESYAERRKLFKTIWETAMNIDEKEDIMSKPKVIKTLRLDEVDKCVVGKKKKQRIKNLRHVCKKILDFCDRQDADDVFYEQVATGQQRGPLQTKIEEKPLKQFKTRKYKKVKRTKSLFGPINFHDDHFKATTSERKNNHVRKAMTKSRNTSPVRFLRRPLVRSTGKVVKSKLSPRKILPEGSSSLGNTNHSHNAAPTRRKVIRKKISKKKKSPNANVPPPPHGKN